MDIETKIAFRTWFGTLTLKPGIRARLELLAHSAAAKAGQDWDSLPPDERWAWKVRQCQEALTRYLKRVRKESGAALRFVLVAEGHKDGTPHFHVLIHETLVDRPVRKRTLQGQWSKLGFSSWKLVEGSEASSYVAKYLAKDFRARVRASLHYGEGATLGGAVRFQRVSDEMKERSDQPSVGSLGRVRNPTVYPPPHPPGPPTDATLGEKTALTRGQEDGNLSNELSSQRPAPISRLSNGGRGHETACEPGLRESVRPSRKDTEGDHGADAFATPEGHWGNTPPF